MKKATVLLSLLVIFLSSFAQADSLPPFKKFPTLPPLKILLADSTTWYTKDDIPNKKPVLIMLFSPECEHCKVETEALISHMEDFIKTEIIMATLLPLQNMKAFYTHYDLGRFKNIVIGRDVNYLLPVFYNVKFLPFLALYDKTGKLIDTFEGSVTIETVIEKFNQ